MSRPDINREDIGMAGVGLALGDVTVSLLGVWWWAFHGMSEHVAVAGWATSGTVGCVAGIMVLIGSMPED